MQGIVVVIAALVVMVNLAVDVVVALLDPRLKFKAAEVLPWGIEHVSATPATD